MTVFGPILTCCLYNIVSYGARDVDGLLNAWERERYDNARERQAQRESERGGGGGANDLTYWAVQRNDESGNEGDVEESDGEEYRLVL